MERHNFDVLSFSMGVVYALVGILFLIPATAFDLVPVLTVSLRWVWPLVILGIGAAIVIPVLRHGRGGDTDTD